jgi:hypothetical protein
MILLGEATAKVKRALEEVPLASEWNDLVILEIQEFDDLWIFHWNNPWRLLDKPYDEYPGADPFVVMKEDGALLQMKRFYGWEDGAFEEALAEVRTRWREGRKSAGKDEGS